MAYSSEEQRKRAAAAAAEAKKRARRQALQSEISSLNAQIGQLESLRSGYSASESAMSDVVTEWKNKKSSLYTGPLMTNVVVSNVFEGDTATYLSGNLPVEISNMDASVVQADNVLGRISQQISNIDRKLSTLRSQVSAKQRELNSI